MELLAGRRHGGVVLTVTWVTDGFLSSTGTSIHKCCDVSGGTVCVLKVHLYQCSVYIHEAVCVYMLDVSTCMCILFSLDAYSYS